MKTNLKIFLIVLALSIFLLSGCQTQENQQLSPAKQSAFKMNTLIKIKFYTAGSNKQEIMDGAFAVIEQLEEKMSTTISKSEISKINKNAGEQKVKVSQDTFTVLKKAKLYAETSDGYFDPTIGPLVNLWGIGSGNQQLPSPEKIKEKLAFVNYKKLHLYPDTGKVYLEQKKMKIDLGGIAKGYAADEVISFFKKRGIKHAFINIGGNVSVLGRKPDEKLWNIGIQDPRHKRGQIVAVIPISNKTVVTSGNYERYFKKNGRRYHHLLNPFTGYPARKGIISVTVVAQNSVKADALATAFYITGIKGIKDKLNEFPNIEVMLITADKKIYITPELEKKINFTKKERYREIITLNSGESR